MPAYFIEEIPFEHEKQAKYNDRGYIKIGRSINSGQKCSSIRTHNPRNAVLLGTIEDKDLSDEEPEASLHKKFSKYNLTREWFYPSNEILDFIKTETVKPIRDIQCAHCGKKTLEWSYSDVGDRGTFLICSHCQKKLVDCYYDEVVDTRFNMMPPVGDPAFLESQRIFIEKYFPYRNDNNILNPNGIEKPIKTKSGKNKKRPSPYFEFEKWGLTFHLHEKDKDSAKEIKHLPKMIRKYYNPENNDLISVNSQKDQEIIENLFNIIWFDGKKKGRRFAGGTLIGLMQWAIKGFSFSFNGFVINLLKPILNNIP